MHGRLGRLSGQPLSLYGQQKLLKRRIKMKLHPLRLQLAEILLLGLLLLTVK